MVLGGRISSLSLFSFLSSLSLSGALLLPMAISPPGQESRKVSFGRKSFWLLVDSVSFSQSHSSSLLSLSLLPFPVQKSPSSSHGDSVAPTGVEKRVMGENRFGWWLAGLCWMDFSLSPVSLSGKPFSFPCRFYTSCSWSKSVVWEKSRFWTWVSVSSLLSVFPSSSPFPVQRELFVMDVDFLSLLSC